MPWSWIEDLKYAEYWRKFNISEDSEKNRDNSGNHPHTSMSGEQPSTSHLDVQSQTRLCMYYKVHIKVLL
jgi:hypothetical protein